MRVEVNDLVDVPYIAEACGVSLQAVYNWRARYPEFSECEIDWVGKSPVFRWTRVRRWLVNNGKLKQPA